MALINCPECNKQISDKANACPNCGFPIDSIQISDTKYDVILAEVFNNSRRILIHNFLIHTKNITSQEAMYKIIYNTPCVIFQNISLSNAKRIKEELLKHNCKVDINESTNNSLPSDETLINNYFDQQSAKPKCPHCGDTNIHKISATSKVVHGAAFGLFSKTARSQFECGNCGFKW